MLGAFDTLEDPTARSDVARFITRHLSHKARLADLALLARFWPLTNRTEALAMLPVAGGVFRQFLTADLLGAVTSKTLTLTHEEYEQAERDLRSLTEGASGLAATGSAFNLLQKGPGGPDQRLLALVHLTASTESVPREHAAFMRKVWPTQSASAQRSREAGGRNTDGKYSSHRAAEAPRQKPAERGQTPVRYFPAPSASLGSLPHVTPKEDR